MSRRCGGRRAPLWLGVLLATGLALTLAGCSGGSGSQAASASSSRSAAPSAGSGAAASGGAVTTNIPALVKRVEPSVVTITTAQGLGSGVIWSANGIIVTDAHVVAGASTVQVDFADGRQTTGTVLAADRFTDLAVVRVAAHGLPAARFAAGSPEVGQTVVVIGSPLGLTETVTSGIVSALDRNLPPSSETPHGLFNLIQTDAPISPGNSGGAVFNTAGEVVGLSEAYVPPSAGAVAIGFATPAAVVRDVVPKLLANGHVDYAYLGIENPVDITPQIAAELGLSQDSGVGVSAVVPGSPAAAAGLRQGDVIVSLAGTPITDTTDLDKVLREHSPGQRVPLVFYRGPARHAVTVTLGSYPAGAGG